MGHIVTPCTSVSDALSRLSIASAFCGVMSVSPLEEEEDEEDELVEGGFFLTIAISIIPSSSSLSLSLLLLLMLLLILPLFDSLVGLVMLASVFSLPRLASEAVVTVATDFVGLGLVVVVEEEEEEVDLDEVIRLRILLSFSLSES